LKKGDFVEVGGHLSFYDSTKEFYNDKPVKKIKIEVEAIHQVDYQEKEVGTNTNTPDEPIAPPEQDITDNYIQGEQTSSEPTPDIVAQAWTESAPSKPKAKTTKKAKPEVEEQGETK
jgi:hypothetical protein